MSTTIHYPRRWQALIVLAFSLLVVTVGNTILNVGLPTIQEELDASASELQWIVDGYLLLFAGLLLAAGSLGDRFGRRRALLTGLAIFGAGSAWAAMAGSATELIASRALMGVGAAGIMPTTLSVITNIFPEDERPKAIAVWAAVAGMGIAIGPIAGGWMIEHFDWSAIFLFNLPAVVVCLAAAVVLVPESRDPNAPWLDVRGCALSFTGLTAVVWALIEAPERGWADATILVAGGTGLAVLAAFIAWERRCEHPLLDVSVFRNLRFSAASLSVTFVYFALMGVMYFLTSYLQSVLGHDALDAGLRMLPIACGMLLTARPSVLLTRRVGTKIPVASGLAAVASALVMLAGFEVDTSDGHIALVLAAMGAGIGMAMAPATEAIMGSLPKAKAGVGSAMNDVVREVAGTLGIAVLGSVLAGAYAGGMDDAVSGLPPEAATAASDSVGAAHAVAAELGAANLAAASNQAFVDAMATTASIAAGIAIAGALIAAAFLPARNSTPDGTAARTGLHQEPRSSRRRPIRMLPPMLLSAYDAVLFDLDGVLVATTAMHAACWKATFDPLLAERGQPPFDAGREYLEHVDGKPRSAGVRDFFRSRGVTLPEPSVEAIGERKQALVERALERDGVDAFPGSVRWIERLRRSGLFTAVVTSSANGDAVLRAAGISALFDLTVDGRDIARRGLRGKPAPDGFLAASAHLGVPAERAVVVEDALAGVAAGRAGEFGLVIGVARHADDAELRAAGADLVVADLGELAA